MQSKVEICGVNTAGLPVLKAAETDALLRRASKGDSTARDELIRGNLRLVLSVVQRFHGRGESADDLFQVGCIGLIKAIDHFNVELGVRFSTYAVPMNILMSKSRKGYIWGHTERSLVYCHAGYTALRVRRRAKERCPCRATAIQRRASLCQVEKSGYFGCLRPVH